MFPVSLTCTENMRRTAKIRRRASARAHCCRCADRPAGPPAGSRAFRPPRVALSANELDHARGSIHDLQDSLASAQSAHAEAVDLAQQLERAVKDAGSR